MTFARYQPALHNNGVHKFVFDRFFGTEASTAWSPRVDIREEATQFVILADVPGVNPQNIEIQMDKNVLSIKGERKNAGAEETGTVTRTERHQGQFERRFALPESADAEGITASGRHGVLEIRIPKKAETTPRRIVVS